MKYQHLLAGLILPALYITTSPVVLAAERQHREHAAHQHGAATLNIAVEDDNLYIELESPAMNIVGFEHLPSNEKQTRKVKQAANSLKNAGQQFGLPAAAQCTVSNVNVESPLLHKPQRKDTAEHSEFHASYIFTCKNISALNKIKVKLFSTFTGMNEIDVQLISNTGQTTKELTASDSTLVINP